MEQVAIEAGSNRQIDTSMKNSTVPIISLNPKNQDSQIGPREIDLQGEIDFERITKAFTRAKIREQERGAWKCFRVAFKFEGKRRSIIYWPALNKISVAYCN